MEFNIPVRQYSVRGGGQQALDLGDGQRGHAAVDRRGLVRLVG
jgi:hypothetical protein